MIASRTGLRPVIARIWRGRTTRENADEYERYMYEEGIKPLKEKALGVQMLREDREHQCRDSKVRKTGQRAPMRTLESRRHWQVYEPSVVWI